MKLNHKVQGQGQPIILLHGVFGSLDNLNSLAKDLALSYQTIQVDLRNHGLSPWSDVMDYDAMAADIASLCHDLQLHDVIVIGHSMGGKVAMKFAAMYPQIVCKVAVIDIAPVTYQHQNNAAVIQAISAVAQQNLVDKKQVAIALRNQGLHEPVVQFLMKSFKHPHWLFNFDVIAQNYNQIMAWQPAAPCLKPALFICGQCSDYVTDTEKQAITQQFPHAKIETIAGAGHNVHAEKTGDVLTQLHNWLAN